MSYILNDRISSMNAIGSYLTLTKDTVRSSTNINSLKSMIKNIEHESRDNLSAIFEFDIVKKPGLLTRLVTGKPVPKTLKLKIDLEMNRKEETGEPKKTPRVLPINTFNIAAALSSSEIVISAKKLNLSEIGSLIPAEKSVVNDLIIPALAAIANDDKLSTEK
jgi:hypothetical protein